MTAKSPETAAYGLNQLPIATITKEAAIKIVKIKVTVPGNNSSPLLIRLAMNDKIKPPIKPSTIPLISAIGT